MALKVEAEGHVVTTLEARMWWWCLAEADGGGS